MLLHSSLEIAGRAVGLYTSEVGLVALSLTTGANPTVERWLRRFFDGAPFSAAGPHPHGFSLRDSASPRAALGLRAPIYPAEGGHELYRRQLVEYFEGRRRIFEFPIDLRGSSFQKDVWNAVASIPFGRTVSYGQIAHLIGRPRASRAVGAANGQNPIPIVVPCHRVIGVSGAPSGYAGGLPLKRQLLALEGLLPAEAVQMRLF